MMYLVPPVGWGDVATTRDLELHRSETKHDLLELRTAVGPEIAATRGELHGEIVATREAISAMEARLGRTLAGWPSAASTRSQTGDEDASNMVMRWGNR